MNADAVAYLNADGDLLSCNLFAYCSNNPLNRFDVDGNWSLPNWAKVVVGVVATAAAVAVTFVTAGTLTPVLASVAVSTVGGAAAGAIEHRITTGSWEGAGEAALNGAVDGFMNGGLGALGGSMIGGATRTIQRARSGLTIGKLGNYEAVADVLNSRYYDGFQALKFWNEHCKKGSRFIDLLEKAAWLQNKCVIKGVMALKGTIYDAGGPITGIYAKELALTKGYEYLYHVWLQ